MLTRIFRIEETRLERSERSRVAQVLIYAALILFALISIVPILHIISVSFSTPNAVTRAGLMLLPEEFTLDSYQFVFRGGAVQRAFMITLFITVVGTSLSLLTTTMAAYALSREDLPGRNFIMIFIIIPLVFSAGIIPGYMLIRDLKLINSVWAMILPAMINSFYLILMRNFFETIPTSLVESARIDGAGEFTILFRIMIPLALPAMMTIGLFYAIAYWNEFFRGIFYITDPQNWPLQVLVRNVVVQADLNELGMSNRDMYGSQTVNQLTIRAATIVVTMAPFAILYPFLQRFFIKGIVLGAEKG
ncbi:MAG: carbohydrate ABC transporter permease [Anaerolineae bacterium]|nr:carbohydrate ABC transporter permease [Anaerolineae bacterium]